MAERYIDNAILKGRVKTGRSHLLNTELNALEKIGLKTIEWKNRHVISHTDKLNIYTIERLFSLANKSLKC